MNKIDQISSGQSTSPMDDPRYLSSVERGLRVLDELSLASGPMSLTELSRQTELAIPTLQRLTATLTKAGYLEKVSGTKRYRPTVKTVDLLYSYLSRNQFAKRAWPYLVQLREKIGLDISLSVPQSNSMIYVHRLPGYRGNFENTLPGKKVPLHLSASGRCLLALRNSEFVKAYFETSPMPKLTPWSKTNPDELMEEISRCRDKGYSLVKQEVSLSMMTLACPVTSGSDALAGVSVHTPIAGIDQVDFIEKILPSIVTVSRAISSE